MSPKNNKVGMIIESWAAAGLCWNFPCESGKLDVINGHLGRSVRIINDRLSGPRLEVPLNLLFKDGLKLSKTSGPVVANPITVRAFCPKFLFHVPHSCYFCFKAASRRKIQALMMTCVD